MTPTTWTMRLRSWLAGALFALAGRLDSAYDVWLDDAPRRGLEDEPECCQGGNQNVECLNCPNGTVEA